MTQQARKDKAEKTLLVCKAKIAKLAILIFILTHMVICITTVTASTQNTMAIDTAGQTTMKSSSSHTRRYSRS